MSDTTDVGGKGKKGGKKPAGEGAGVQGHIARMLVRAVWAQEWHTANPEGTKEVREAAWKEARPGLMEKNLKVYRRALVTLQRAGVTMAVAESAPGKAEADDGEQA